MLASGFFLNQWGSGFVEPFGNTKTMLVQMLLGLFLYYFVVDKHMLRFVVKQGQEGYYTASRRFG